MNTNTTQQMDLNNIIQTLVKKFGTDVVRTSDVVSYIDSIGQNHRRFYVDLREKFSVSHGKMQFQENAHSIVSVAAKEYIVENDSEIETRINRRFNALEVMARATAKVSIELLLLAVLLVSANLLV